LLTLAITAAPIGLGYGAGEAGKVVAAGGGLIDAAASLAKNSLVQATLVTVTAGTSVASLALGSDAPSWLGIVSAAAGGLSLGLAFAAASSSAAAAGAPPATARRSSGFAANGRKEVLADDRTPPPPGWTYEEAVAAALGIPGIPRLPDFYSFNLNVAIPTPWTGTLLGGTGSVTVDRYGRVFAGGGPNIGKALTFVSGSITAGWMNASTIPSEPQLASFLGGGSYSVGGGLWGGVALSYSPGYGIRGATATNIGGFTPQFGAGWTYNWQFE
jgi:hypothetical protein